MRKWFLWALLALPMLMAQARETKDVDRVKVGDEAPAFTIVKDDGRRIASSEFAGRVVVINFFATWCPPCQKELAEVERVLWPKYKDEKGFAMLVIGREHTDAELAKYNEKKGFTFPLYPDRDRAIFDAFAESLIPRTYLLDREGRVAWMTEGYKEEALAELMAQIDQLLKE